MKERKGALPRRAAAAADDDPVQRSLRSAAEWARRRGGYSLHADEEKERYVDLIAAEDGIFLSILTTESLPELPLQSLTVDGVEFSVEQLPHDQVAANQWVVQLPVDRADLGADVDLVLTFEGAPMTLRFRLDPEEEG